MSIVSVAVNGQALHITEAPVIAAYGIKENYIQFTFDYTWSGFGKTAIFYRDGDEDTIYQTAVDANGLAMVPHEVTDDDGLIWFGVCGAKDDVVLTSEVLSYKIREGAYPSGQESVEPTPGIYEQILTIAGEMSALYEAVKESVITANSRISNEIANRQAGDATLAAQMASIITDQTAVIDNPHKIIKLEFDADVSYSASGGSIWGNVTIPSEYEDFLLLSVIYRRDRYYYPFGGWEDSEGNAWYEISVDGRTILYSMDPADVPENTNGHECKIMVLIAVPSVPSEVVDGRIGADGTEYDTLGEAIRGQITNIEDELFQIVLDENGYIIAFVDGGTSYAIRPNVSGEEVAPAVESWLDEHPEATTTVQDGSITVAKFASTVRMTNAEIDEIVG